MEPPSSVLTDDNSQSDQRSDDPLSHPALHCGTDYARRNTPAGESFRS